MQRWKTGVLTAMLLLGIANAPAQQPANVPENVAKFWKQVDRAKTVSYTVKVWFNEPRMSDEVVPRSTFYVAHTYDVTAQRPNRISILGTPGYELETTEGGRTQQGFINFGDNVYISDGKQSISMGSMFHLYKLDKGLTALSATKPDLMSRIESELIFDSRHFDGYKRSPDEYLLPSGKAVVYRLEDPAQPDQCQKIYLDGYTGQLIRVSDFYKRDGVWGESGRWGFSFWEFDVPLPTGIFSVRPPRTYRTMAERSEEAKKMLERRTGSGGTVGK